MMNAALPIPDRAPLDFQGVALRSAFGVLPADARILAARASRPLGAAWADIVRRLEMLLEPALARDVAPPGPPPRRREPRSVRHSVRLLVGEWARRQAGLVGFASRAGMEVRANEAFFAARGASCTLAAGTLVADGRPVADAMREDVPIPSVGSGRKALGFFLVGGRMLAALCEQCDVAVRDEEAIASARHAAECLLHSRDPNGDTPLLREVRRYRRTIRALGSTTPMGKGNTGDLQRLAAASLRATAATIFSWQRTGDLRRLAAALDGKERGTPPELLEASRALRAAPGPEAKTARVLLLLVLGQLLARGDRRSQHVHLLQELGVPDSQASRLGFEKHWDLILSPG